ncbi:PIN domain-containing protein [Sphingomonas sp. KR3-1]|uniref:PIN domain-containing protein n=1 Tax=Sphingomonas sp. KR3-1 TaxID=3156611 RepID=UPI0032B3EB20
MSKSDGKRSSARLKTPWVFIDTQAFRSANINWNARSWGRFAELSRTGMIRPITTSITKREVDRRIVEALRDAETAVTKNRVIFDQLHPGLMLDSDHDRREAALLDAFHTYLQKARFLEIALTAEPGAIFDSYFARTPPFSDGKKDEFPDAFVLHSLRNWLDETRNSLYVVSDDKDMRTFCESDDRLISVESLNAFLSAAQAHGALLSNIQSHVQNDAGFLAWVDGNLARFSASMSSVAVHDIEFHDVEVASVLLIDEDETANELHIAVEMEAGVSLEVTETSFKMIVDRHGDPDMDMESTERSITATTMFEVELALVARGDQEHPVFETRDRYFSASEISVELPRGFDARRLTLRR